MGFALLLERADGVFGVAILQNGEIGSYHPRFVSLMEFEFDEDGRAVRWVTRSPRDQIMAIGKRVGR